MRQATRGTELESKARFKRILWILALTGLVLTFRTANAAPLISPQSEDFRSFDEHSAPQDFDEYFKIDRASALQQLAQGFEDLVELGEQMIHPPVESQARAINLLQWKRVPEAPASPPEPYNRKKHFGNWRRVGSGCVNVRARVLMRDSTSRVEMRDSGCSVESGTWEDAYTSGTYTNAEDMDIDHFVPLKNAYVSGGSLWARKKFCRYGNFLKNGFHLIPAYKIENRKKSDMTPADYMPPNKEFHCEYAIRWLKIKAIWGLVMMPPEVEALQKIVIKNQCDVAQFKMDLREFDANQAATESDPICDTF